MSGRGPAFFCEHCGAEVGRNDRACRRCGRFFSNVRCPSCGFTGSESLFGGGCPACGYSAPAAASRNAGKRSARGASPLPLWVYLVTAAALAAVIAAVLFSMR